MSFLGGSYQNGYKGLVSLVLGIGGFGIGVAISLKGLIVGFGMAGFWVELILGLGSVIWLFPVATMEAGVALDSVATLEASVALDSVATGEAGVIVGPAVRAGLGSV